MDDLMDTNPHPYQSLTPDVVMDALASVGLYGDGRQMPLSSYENRVYQLHLEDGAVVAPVWRFCFQRLPPPGWTTTRTR